MCYTNKAEGIFLELIDESEECPLLQSIIGIHFSNLILSVSNFSTVQLRMGFLGRIIFIPSEERVFSLAHQSWAQLASTSQGSEDHSLASMYGNTC